MKNFLKCFGSLVIVVGVVALFVGAIVSALYDDIKDYEEYSEYYSEYYAEMPVHLYINKETGEIKRFETWSEEEESIANNPDWERKIEME